MRTGLRPGGVFAPRSSVNDSVNGNVPKAANLPAQTTAMSISSQVSRLVAVNQLLARQGLGVRVPVSAPRSTCIGPRPKIVAEAIVHAPCAFGRSWRWACQVAAQVDLERNDELGGFRLPAERMSAAFTMKTYKPLSC